MSDVLKADETGILAYIPHALKFQPKRSLVVVTMHGRAIGATLRLDLPDVEQVEPFGAQVVQYLSADLGATEVVLATYTHLPVGGTRPHRQVVRALGAILSDAGLPVRTAFVIGPDGFREHLCTDDSCNRIRPLSEIVESSLNAELVFRGSSYTETPGPRIPEFAGGPLVEERIRAASAALPDCDPHDFGAGEMLTARHIWGTGLYAENMTEEGAIRMLTYMNRAPYRDRIIADLIGPDAEYADAFMGKMEVVDWERVDRAERTLLNLLLFTPGKYRAHLLTPLAWLYWHKGQGAASARLVKEALDADPKYRLALLLEQLFDTGILPTVAMKEATSYGSYKAKGQKA